MPVYRYKARTQTGETVSGLVEAPETPVAMQLLHDKGLFVVKLSQSKDELSFAKLFSQFQRVSFTEIVNFTRQLSTMVTAGLSLPEALTILRQQTTNPKMVKFLTDVEHNIVGGGNLATALARYPDLFPGTYIALVRAGESSGTLEKVLSRLAETLEAQKEFRSKVSGTMIYPVIILIGMFIVMMVMMTVVVPKLTELYTDFGIDLPASTKILIATSKFFVRFWWVIIAVVVGGGVGFARWRKTPVGELMVDGLILKIPLFGDLTKKIILVEFTRTLSMLISSGIHILEGMTILRGTLGNVHFRNAITDISKKVEKGFPLGETFGQYPVFPPIVSQMMKVGEETGKLDDTLLKLSSYFESESEHLVKGLTTALEPLIMVVMGIGVGFIVFSVITPIYNLTSGIK